MHRVKQQNFLAVYHRGNRQAELTQERWQYLEQNTAVHKNNQLIGRMYHFIFLTLRVQTNNNSVNTIVRDLRESVLELCITVQYQWTNTDLDGISWNTDITLTFIYLLLQKLQNVHFLLWRTMLCKLYFDFKFFDRTTRLCLSMRLLCLNRSHVLIHANDSKKLKYLWKHLDLMSIDLLE